MIDFIIQFLGASLLFTGLWLMGNKRLLGPCITACAELFTTIIGVTHKTWSIIVIGVVLCFVQARNFFKWRSEGTPW